MLCGANFSFQRDAFIVIFRRQIAVRNRLADSVLKLSPDIGIFVNTRKTEFLHFLMDSPVQCYLEKASLWKTFVHVICASRVF